MTPEKMTVEEALALLAENYGSLRVAAAHAGMSPTTLKRLVEPGRAFKTKTLLKLQALSEGKQVKMFPIEPEKLKAAWGTLHYLAAMP